LKQILCLEGEYQTLSVRTVRKSGMDLVDKALAQKLTVQDVLVQTNPGFDTFFFHRVIALPVEPPQNLCAAFWNEEDDEKETLGHVSSEPCFEF
jgi:hypothetical protein